MQVLNGEVLDTVVVGNRVIVVGTFTQVSNPGGGTINQPYIAAYNADTGRFDGSFRPDVDNFVNAVAADGDNVFVVGQFSNAGGEAHRRIAKFNADGSINSRFTASFGSTPTTLDVAHGKVYVGGPFTVVNNVPREAFAAVSATTGSLDSATDFDFSESTQFFGGIGVRWLEVSPDGNFLFLTHSARRIDGQIRSGIARFDISANATTLSNWQTLLYDDELERFTLRLRRLAISPDGSYVVSVTSGGDRPPSGDTAIRFPTTGGANVQPDWVSRHFDTVLGVAISDDVVFVGGHFLFQEAPGSTNPFPGDPNISYGFDSNQGPQVLGSEVVQREQLGALNSATGKSLAWNPGSDSFIAVQSLTWDDDLGLLVGHDGSRLGGVNTIGRHAIFPAGSTPVTPPEPGGDFSGAASFGGGNATVTFTGDRGGSLNLLGNGTWVQTVNSATTTISANAGDTIVARLRGANFDQPYEDFTCTTGDGGGTPVGQITTTVTSPSNNGVVGNENVTITGAATAPDGLDRVRLSVVRRATGQYLTPAGTFVDAWTPLDVDVTGTSDTWSLNVTLPAAGQYDITARTFDADGDRNESIRSSFLVGALTNSPPELSTNGAILDGRFTNFSGFASDDIGVDSVQLLIQKGNTFEYFRVDGTMGVAQRHDATLSSAGGKNTNWSITVEDLPPGEWEVTVDARDTSGQRDRASVFFRNDQ